MGSFGETFCKNMQSFIQYGHTVFRLLLMSAIPHREREREREREILLTFKGPNFCCKNPLSMQTSGVATLSMLTEIQF